MLGSFFKPFYYILICLVILILFISCLFAPVISTEVLLSYDLNAIENMEISGARFFVANTRLYQNKFIFW